MRTVNEWIRRHLDREFARSNPNEPSGLFVNHQELRDGLKRNIFEFLQDHQHFLRLRISRMMMGYLRYEAVLGKAPNYLERIRRATDDYERTGNREFLVDLANYVEMEWVNPSILNTYFEVIDAERQEL